MFPVIVARLLKSGDARRGGDRRRRRPTARARCTAPTRSSRRSASRWSPPSARMRSRSSFQSGDFPAATSARASSMIGSDVTRPGYVEAASSLPRRFLSSSRCSRDAAVGFVGRRRRRTFTASRQLLDDAVGRELAVSELRPFVLRDRAHDRPELREHARTLRAPTARATPRRRRSPRRASRSSARAGLRDRSSARTGTRSPTE